MCNKCKKVKEYSKHIGNEVIDSDKTQNSFQAYRNICIMGTGIVSILMWEYLAVKNNHINMPSNILDRCATSIENTFQELGNNISYGIHNISRSVYDISYLSYRIAHPIIRIISSPFQMVFGETPKIKDDKKIIKYKIE